VRAQLLAFAATLVLAAACGARTGLEVPPPAPHGQGGAPPDAAPDVGPDVAPDTGPDALDAPPDTPPDVFDAPPDAPPDVFDAPADAPPDVVVTNCVEAGVTFIYLVSEAGNLMAYYPPTNAFNTIGLIGCPASNTFSMAVDRAGIAYVEFNDGNLYRVDTANASCQTTSFVPGQDGIANFGMGYSADVTDRGETLYIASTVGNGGTSGLGTIDTLDMKLSFIGQFSKPVGSAELTGTGDGQLYGFSPNDVNGSHLVHIDKTNAAIMEDVVLPILPAGAGAVAWAFAFWGGDFYFFTSTDNATTDVTRYRPADQSLVVVTTLPSDVIVGAGVSTCAPE
jgi:hypothetical protein